MSFHYFVKHKKQLNEMQARFYDPIIHMLVIGMKPDIVLYLFEPTIDGTTIVIHNIELVIKKYPDSFIID